MSTLPSHPVLSCLYVFLSLSFLSSGSGKPLPLPRSLLAPAHGTAIDNRFSVACVLLFGKSEVGVDQRGGGFTHWDSISNHLRNARVLGIHKDGAIFFFTGCAWRLDFLSSTSGFQSFPPRIAKGSMNRERLLPLRPNERYGTAAPSKTTRDLPILQRMTEDRVFKNGY